MVYILGLGHIGLPLAIWIALSGKKVFGIDKDRTKIEEITTGRINITEYYRGTPLKTLATELIRKELLIVNHRIERPGNEPTVFIVTVGMGQLREDAPHFSALLTLLEELCPLLMDEDLIIFRGTLSPGTCADILLPEIRKHKKRIYVAYCPETVQETSIFSELSTNPLILSAADEESYRQAEKFLQSLPFSSIHRAQSMEAAETAKVVQNIYRDVNIAFANEISRISSELKVTTNELLRLANTHPRVNILQPGPGVGGYCLPFALGFLLKSLPEGMKGDLPLSTTARSINRGKPHLVLGTVRKALKQDGKTIDTARIAIFGLAMKDYCSDTRHSPAVEIMNMLIENGAQVKAYDPLVPPEFPYRTPSFKESIKDADLLLITGKQPGIEIYIWEMLFNKECPPSIVDTRNIFPPSERTKLYRV